jgi:transposase
LVVRRSPTRGDIGLDVHAASCTVAIISQAGKRLKDFPVETNGQALVEAIRMIPGRKHLVFEEGLQSAWLYEILSPHVDETVVAGVTESRGQKNDTRDAYGLAEKLRTGALAKRIFKAPREFSLLRELARMHLTVVRDVVRVQSRLKSLYRSRGIPASGGSVYSAREREDWEKRLPASARRRAARLYTQLDFLVAQRDEAERELVQESRKHAIVPILETAPGIGPIRAARLVPIVVTPHRFRTQRPFWSYCGFVRNRCANQRLAFVTQGKSRMR